MRILESYLPIAAMVLIVVIVIDKDRSPFSRYEYMLLPPPPGQHPATKIPRDTVDCSVTSFPTVNAI